MAYRAEIFDQVQYLFDQTGFNDHQLHCVIRFKNKINTAAMEKSFRLLTGAAPILSRVYRNAGGNSYWEDTGARDVRDLFAVVGNSRDFDAFTFSSTDAEKGPQIRGCLLQSDSDALSVIVNHMVTDGAGMKECVYLLSRMYSEVLLNPGYTPDFVIDGDRDCGKVLSRLSLRDRLRILLFRSGDNNAPGRHTFPLSDGGIAEPFIMTHALPPEKLGEIIRFGKQNDATVNDVVLSAYFRVLSSLLGLREGTLCIPLMIDMRRYLPDYSFSALANYASTEIIKLGVYPEERFAETLSRVSAISRAKKDNDFGLNSFVKLRTLYKICGRKRAYALLERHLKNPNICITNIGVIDEKRLVFKGAEIEDAYITGSVKYKPHFQMSLTSYQNKMTLAVNLYGNERDRDKIREFFSMMDRELDAVAPN